MQNVLRITITAFVALLALAANAQTIYGNQSPNLSTSYTYYFSGGGIIVSPQWRMSLNKGVIMSQWQSGSSYYVDIIWTTGGSETLAFLDGNTARAQLSINILAPPAAPTANNAGSITTTSFIANWTTVSGATSYSLDVATNNTFTAGLTTYNGITTNSKSVTGLTTGSVYYYRVRAVNAAGSSSNSATKTVQTSGPPPTPTLSSPTNITTSGFTANWTLLPGATSYTLEVSLSSSYSPLLNTYSGITASTYAVSSLSPGTRYYYRLKALNAAGSSGYATANVETALAAPVATTSNYLTSASFRAKWNAVTGAASYELDVAADNTFPVGQVTTYTGITTTTKDVTGLSAQNKYYYRVRSVSSLGTPSANSNAMPGVDLDQNFIRTVDVMVPGKTTVTAVESATLNEALTRYDFFDGLGRPIQTVAMQASPLAKDIVQPMAYDQLGRESKKYLPYVDEATGWYKANALKDPTTQETLQQAIYQSGKQYAFYQSGGVLATDAMPYAETLFETSPLSLVREQGAPGAAWQPNTSSTYASPVVTDRSQKQTYGSNVAGEVLRFTYTYPVSPDHLGLVEAGTASVPVYYAASDLRTSRSKDAHNNEVITYVDKEGRTVLRRVQAQSGTPAVNDTNYASTYYIYDDFGSLVCVISPEAVSKLSTEYFHAEADNVSKESFLRRWAFRYKYDARRRMIQKQLPGAGQVFMVYDDRDRLVLTQDSVQRLASPKRWTFIKYDQFNRPVATGIKDSTATLTQMQDGVKMHYAKAWTKYYETYIGNVAGNLHGYSNKSYPVITGPTTTIDPHRYLTVTYYDNYSFLSVWTGSYTYVNDALSQQVNGITYTQPSAGSTDTKGQVTGIKVKVLDVGVTSTNTWLKSVNYYDDKYRQIQGISDNYRGGSDRISNLYDFTGKVLVTKTTHPEHDVVWTEKVNATTNGNTLFKNTSGGAWNTSGAVSQQKLAAGQDGWVEVTASETSLHRMVGLSDQNNDNHYLTIDYAFYMAINSALVVYESGTARYTIPGGYATGDLLRIERTGSIIKYYRNNILVYTSTVPSSTLLMVDASLHTANASIVNARASFSPATQTITRRMEYDHAGRLVNAWHRLNENSEILLSHNQYNELGQLIDRKLHSTVATASDAKQSVDYRYNIRGWLESMNNASLSNDGATNDDDNDYFGMNLGYQTDIGPGNAPLYNGNISAMRWSNNLGLGDVKENSYTFSYDPMNRLTAASFKEKQTSWNAASANGFSESGYQYDLNGNIKRLTRHDKRGSSTIMDDLTYDYGATTTQSNKLLYVTDSGDDYAGFVDGNPAATTDYTYDANGNITRDLNKGIGNTLTDNTNLVTYNFLNLPETVTKGGNSIRYIYDATGRKLAQLVTFGGITRQTDYSREFTYEDGVLQFISHEEGRIVVAAPKLIYTNPAEEITAFTATNATLAAVTQNGADKYVKVTSNGTVSRTGVFPVGGTFTVAAGERYRIRVRGYRTGTNAAYILVKVNSADLNWPGAALPSSAATEAWVEQVITIPGTASVPLQIGVVWNTVTTGEIMYLNDVEITKLESSVPEYQYNLKDHLGNVRLTFTTKVQTATNYSTNFEAASAPDFQNYSNTTYDLVDHTDAGGTVYSKVQLLNGGVNGRVGLSKSLPVMPGDEITASAYVKYMNLSGTGNPNAFINSLATAFGVSSGSTGEGLKVYNGLNSYATTVPGGDHDDDSESAPKAFVTILFFDKDYNLLDAAWDQVTTTGAQSSPTVKEPPHDLVSVTAKAPGAGYAYIFLSNEHPTFVDVYFDDVTFSHTASPVVSVSDYYPFGLAFNSNQRENTAKQDYLYNSKEIQDELSLGWLDYGARMYMPEIGRWGVNDPLAMIAPGISPYSYCYDNPINYIDPTGMYAEQDMYGRDRYDSFTGSYVAPMDREGGTGSESGGRNGAGNQPQAQDGRKREITRHDVAASYGLQEYGTDVYVGGKLQSHTPEGYYLVPEGHKQGEKSPIPGEKIWYSRIHDTYHDIVRQHRITHTKSGYVVTISVVEIHYKHDKDGRLRHSFKPYGYQRQEYIEYGTMEQYEDSPFVETHIGDFKPDDLFWRQLKGTVNEHCMCDEYVESVERKNKLRAVSNNRHR